MGFVEGSRPEEHDACLGNCQFRVYEPFLRGRLKVLLGCIMRQANNLALFVHHHETNTRGDEILRLWDIFHVKLRLVFFDGESILELSDSQRPLGVDDPYESLLSQVAKAPLLATNSLHSLVICL